MAAEALRAPRIAPHATSMAVLAAGLTTPDVNFAAAWAKSWKACGGTLTARPNGDRFIGRAETMAGHPAAYIGLQSEDERQGALKVLAALLHAAGPAAIGAVFVFADQIPECVA